MQWTTARDLPGYETVADLIPDVRFLRYTDLWSVTFGFVRDWNGATKRRLVLGMTNLWANEPNLIQISMMCPLQVTFGNVCDSSQIIGLTFEDIRARGWEDVTFRVADDEMSGFEVFCKSIELSRGLIA